MTVIESVRNYIKTYPGISGEQIKVDFLSEEASSYSVDLIPCNSIVKRYVDGSSIRQFLFVFASREYSGAETRQQIDNLGFFESFQNWIEENSYSKILPTLTDGREARTMEVTASGYVFAPDVDTARYQMQCRLEYYQPALLPDEDEEETEE